MRESAVPRLSTFCTVCFQNSRMYLSSYTTAAVPENIFCYVIVCILLRVSLVYYLCIYPDIKSHQSLCFQGSIIDCKNVNSFLVKGFLNLC